jgi:hypothetical protein
MDFLFILHFLRNKYLLKLKISLQQKFKTVIQRRTQFEM